MKQSYTTPLLSLLRFNDNDIVTTSSGNGSSQVFFSDGDDTLKIPASWGN